MSFRSFPSNTDGDNHSLPWFEELVKSDSQTVGKTIDVKSVRLTVKGMMIITNQAKGFIYQSHPAYCHVLTYVKAWSGRKEESPILQVMVTDIRPFINLGVDDERHGVWSVETNQTWCQAYSTVSDNPDIKSPINPFPLPSPSDSGLSDSQSGERSTLAKDGIIMQTSQEMPLGGPGRQVNHVKRTKTSKQG